MKGKAQEFLRASDNSYTLVLALSDGKVEGVFFGTLWISHPDLAKRLEHGKPLDNAIDFTTLYGKYYASEEEQKKGYVDYPEAQYKVLG